MSDSPDFNIENYSLEDLIELIGAPSSQTQESIRGAVNNAVRQFEALQNSPAAAFFKEVGEKLLDNFEKLQTLIDTLDQREVTDPGQNMFENEYYDSGDTSTFLAKQLPNRQENISVLEPTNHMTQGQGRLLIPNTHNVNTVQGNMNPNLKNTYLNIINVDSQYREIKSGSVVCSGVIADTSNNYLGTSTDFTFDLSEPLNNVISITVGSVEVPRTWYPFNEQFGTNSFELTKSGAIHRITIPEGFYDTATLLENAIQTAITAAAVAGITITIDGTNTLKTTIKSTTGPFNLNFVPDISGCNINNSGAKIDYNLGWMLGFRQPQYPMAGVVGADPTNSYQSEGCVDIFGTRYLLLKVNDFQSNRVTGGMVSLTDNQNKFKLPSYYRKVQASMPFCSTDVNGKINPSAPATASTSVDPSGAVLQRPNSNGRETFKRACRKGTQNPYAIIDGSNNLTNAQKYTAQQIVIAQKNISQNRYFAPTDTDILLRFPVDRDSPDRTVPMIYENDGIQKRTYFGPTTLKRLRVQLLDDKGYPVNLGNMNFSFSLIVEQLYQY
jgi:hypothetical protein